MDGKAVGLEARLRRPCGSTIEPAMFRPAASLSCWWCSRVSSEFPPVFVEVWSVAAGYNARLAPDRRMTRTISATVLLCLVCTVAGAQSRPRTFAGVAVGIATLSADARSEITAGGADVSLYKPENGPALNVFVGSHFHEYL